VDREDLFCIGEPSGFVHSVWPAQPEYLGSVRAAVRSWLSGLDLSADVQRDLVLAASEAASNAIEHAYSPEPSSASMVELTLWTELNALCIEIVDYGSWLAPPSIAPVDRGRGIQLMQQLARSVVISAGNVGTTVLLQHPLPINGHVAPGL
jgi:anti-sigma regulatory factor (Ser/Thr protein kinase)